MALKPYAGIGARQTPLEIQQIMAALAGKLESEGWLLRSGGAAGADSAFERGVITPAAKEIYLSAPVVRGRSAAEPGVINAAGLPSWSQALATVNQFHPNPGALGDFARGLMARNAMQVLGPDLNDPVKMVVAYTPGGQIVGGTGQALRMAQAYGIPVRNLGDSQTLEKVLSWLS